MILHYLRALELALASKKNQWLIFVPPDFGLLEISEDIRVCGIWFTPSSTEMILESLKLPEWKAHFS